MTVKLLKPDSKWQYTPAASPGLVYSQADYLKKGASFGTPSGMPVGTGPYKWVEFTPNSRVVLVRNPYWKGVKYPWDRIVFPLIPDAQRSPARAPERADRRDVRRSRQRPPTLAEGVGHEGRHVQLRRVARLLARRRGRAVQGRQRAACDRVLARQGRRSPKALTSSRGKVLEGLPPLIFIKALLPKAEINTALKKVPTYPYSVDKAKAELAKSAYPKGFKTTLNVPTGCVPCLLLAQVLQQGAEQDRDRHQAQHDARAAAVPGHPRPQAATSASRCSARARTRRTRWTSPTCSYDELARQRRGTRTRRTTRTRTVDKLIAGVARDVRPQGCGAERAQDHADRHERDLPYIPVFCSRARGGSSPGGSSSHRSGRSSTTRCG